MDNCVSCDFPVEKVKGRAVGPCGHVMHVSCLLKTYQVIGNCPSCQRVLYEGALVTEDNGMDPEITSIQLKQIREVFLEKKKNTVTHKVAQVFWDFFTVKKSVKDAMKEGASYAEIKKNYTMNNIVRSKLTLKEWFQHGYTMENLFEFRPTMDDLFSMGMTIEDIKNKLPSLSMLLQYCPDVNLMDFTFTLKDIQNMDVEDLKRAGIKYEQLKIKGLDHPLTSDFKFTKAQWIELGAPPGLFDPPKPVSVPTALHEKRY